MTLWLTYLRVVSADSECMPDGTSESPASSPFSSHAEDRLGDMSPSVKLVAFVLRHHQELTKQGLKTKTLLPGRTVRYAIDHLETAELVTVRPSLRDSRKNLYRWSNSGE